MRVTDLIPPIATPFYNGRIDFESLHRLLQYLDPVVSGFLVGGSVGEHPSLTVEERIALVRAVAAHKQPGRRLVAGVADNSIENSIRLAEAAEQCGADLLIVSCPNYYTNSLPMVAAFLGALAARTSVDLCLYDNPAATHTMLSVADVIWLTTQIPRLTHIKVTDLSPEKVSRLLAETQLTVLAGEDAVLWRMLARGAHGAMVALPMIYPEESRALWAALQEGRPEEAAALYRPVSHFLHVALGAADYVQVIKEVLHARGIIRSAEVRVPLCPLDDMRRAEVLAAL
jgi:4-hydroxy-tetrahydrodipicolinate synthase